MGEDAARGAWGILSSFAGPVASDKADQQRGHKGGGDRKAKDQAGGRGLRKKSHQDLQGLAPGSSTPFGVPELRTARISLWRTPCGPLPFGSPSPVPWR